MGNMGKKSERLGIIRRIITEELVGSQEELIKHLARYGVHATQSTLSRDFKEINITKMSHPDKGYIYMLAEHMATRSEMGTSNLCDAILGVKFSGNICVVMTKSGYANALAVVIDGRKSPDIVGSVAGDNTILLVMREGATSEDVLKVLSTIFPALDIL